MSIFATNGAKVYIGGVITLSGADLTEASFTSQAWVEIGETESIGSYGDTASEITFDSIAASRTRRLKGTRNAGTLELTCGLDATDAGQLALITAEQASADYAFKIVLTDAPTGGTASERKFAAKVAQAAEQLDSANSVMKLVSQLWINSNIVRKAAAAGGGS